jgi:hypothetical protein
MRALVDSDELFALQHGDGRKELMERLASAAHAGELPEYMREFVDSVSAHAERRPRSDLGTGLRRLDRPTCPQDLST